jgi:Spy/CpxP family protein refolding chaperone
MTLGVLAVVTAGLVTGAAALAFAHGARHGMMKRFASAVIDDALDAAKVTAEQRAAVHAARDRVFDALAEHRRARKDRLAEALALFEADQVDPARVEALRRLGEDEHRAIADAVSQALVEVHGVLTPEQRRAVADYVRSHRPRHL